MFPNRKSDPPEQTASTMGSSSWQTRSVLAVTDDPEPGDRWLLDRSVGVRDVCGDEDNWKTPVIREGGLRQYGWAAADFFGW